MTRGGGRGAVHSVARAARSANTRSSGSKNRSRSAPSRRTNSNSCTKTGGRNRSLSGTSKSTKKTPRSASKSPFTNRSTSTWSNVSQYDTMRTGPMTGRSSSINSTRSSRKENIQKALIVPNIPNLDRTERSLLSAIENGSRRDSAASAKSRRGLNSQQSLKSTKSRKSRRKARSRSRKSARLGKSRKSKKSRRSRKSAMKSRSRSRRSKGSVRFERDISADKSSKSGRSQRDQSIDKLMESGRSQRNQSIDKSVKSGRSRQSQSIDKSTKSGRSRRSQSIDKSTKSGRSQSAGSMSMNSSSSQPVSTQERGRTLIRNRDLHEQRKNARTTGRSTSLPITQTDHLTERDGQFEKLRKTPADNKREWNRRFPPGHVVVYTDASVAGNVSGFGIYHGPKHVLNRSEVINQPPHDSTRAEILAATQALRNLREWKGYKNEPVILRTDAHLIDMALSGQQRNWDWYVRGKSAWQKELAELKEEAEKFPQGVTFEHVYAHQDDPGNEAADDLARQATVGPQRSRSMSRGRSGAPQRMRSLSNDPEHIRSHSAHVEGRRRLA